MPANTLFVKNMVCHRCILAAEDILKKLDIPFHKIVLGEIHLSSTISQEQRDLISSHFISIGLEIIDDRISGLIEKIKKMVVGKARMEADEPEHSIKLSVYLNEKLGREYTHISSLFSSVEGRTIENYYIEQRVEKVKELLVYNEMNLSEIAYQMDYSSPAHLSSQFKKITGLTPSHFKELGSHKRKLLDQI